MVAGSYFAKSEIVQAVTSCGLHFISRLQAAPFSKVNF
jgi:hypothetical protein